MKKIGIIGGMGPLATIDLFTKIVGHTHAQKDQENIPILINNNPQVPDRTQSILYGGVSPVPAIVETGRSLEKMGADFLLMPCNTSHYYFEKIQGELKIELVNMVDLAVEEIARNQCKKVCVLGTEGTLKIKIYEKKLEEKGIQSLDVGPQMMDILSYVIYDVVKAGNFPKDLPDFRKLLKEVEDQGTQAFVLACTELPVLFEKYDLNFPTIDPTDILAREAVKRAKQE